MKIYKVFVATAAIIISIFYTPCNGMLRPSRVSVCPHHGQLLNLMRRCNYRFLQQQFGLNLTKQIQFLKQTHQQLCIELKRLNREGSIVLREALHCRTDQSGDTLLHLAVESDYAKLVKTLLYYGAPINLTNKKGQTPINIAQAGLEYFSTTRIPKNPNAQEVFRWRLTGARTIRTLLLNRCNNKLFHAINQCSLMEVKTFLHLGARLGIIGRCRMNPIGYAYHKIKMLTKHHENSEKIAHAKQILDLLIEWHAQELRIAKKRHDSQATEALLNAAKTIERIEQERTRDEEDEIESSEETDSEEDLSRDEVFVKKWKEIHRHK